ncbi:MAG TPA: ABC transporter substrate-binding protein [Burkholderiales bacterium]|nr:ABC transporter substrate-binding protein [Burkholderiales bacterium]
MIQRRLLLAVALNLAVATTCAWAQPTNKVPVVGYLRLAGDPDDPVIMAWRKGLRELGYVEGRTIRVELRTAQGNPDRLQSLADELVQLKADVIVGTNPLAAQALRRATSTVPIVVALFDPVANGLVTNLAHPGGNVTGLSSLSTELFSKRLQLLKETNPRLARVAVLWNPATPPTPLQAGMVDVLKEAARSLSVELKFVLAKTPEEFDLAFLAVSRAQSQALYLHENPLYYVHRVTLAKLALNARLPAIYASRTFADEGGLMSYGANYADQMRRAAVYVDKILKGAKPGDLPIEQPTKFELVVNLKTAKALGIEFPQSILLRADEVIR